MRRNLKVVILFLFIRSKFHLYVIYLEKEKKSDKEEKRLSVRGKALSKIDEDSCESNLHSESGRGRNAVVASTYYSHVYVYFRA